MHMCLQVVGGMMLHLQRNSDRSSCAEAFAKLVLYCSGAVVDTAASAQGQAYGLDPAFNARSPMFDQDAVATEGDFYNTSRGSPEVNSLGFPYGFFRRAVPARPLGYPVVFPVQASRAAVSKQLAVLREAGYIDARTQLLAATLVTYNVAARTFGVVNIDTRQSSVGAFEQEVAVSAVNAAWPLSTLAGVRAMALPALAALLALASAVHVVLAAVQWASKRKAKARTRPSSVWLCPCLVGGTALRERSHRSALCTSLADAVVLAPASMRPHHTHMHSATKASI
jgi:Polycystin cation channel